MDHKPPRYIVVRCCMNMRSVRRACFHIAALEIYLVLPLQPSAPKVTWIRPYTHAFSHEEFVHEIVDTQLVCSPYVGLLNPRNLPLMIAAYDCHLSPAEAPAPTPKVFVVSY
jgi:hypothetical protein